MKLRKIWLAVLMLLLPLGAAAAGLPIHQKTVTFKSKAIDISVSYPLTGNKQIDDTFAAYARRSIDEYKTMQPDFADGDHQYMLETSYEVIRNDGKMFDVLFTEYSDTGGAHPNSNYEAFNFLLPDGHQVFLPEIVDGARGLKKVSALTIATLIKNIGSGTEPVSDKDTILMGTAPAADNFKNFAWEANRLHLYFAPYQVAAYAAGPQEAIIPLSQLKDVIRPDWRAPAASFDCTKAATVIEHAICADPALARLDRQTAEAYQTAIRNAYEPIAQEKVRQGQRDWIAKRNATCNNAAAAPCLAKLYRDRIAALTKP